MAVQQIQKDDSRTIRAWAMYDWANSAYALVVSSAIFPAYYNSVTRVNGSGRISFMGIEVENTGLYSIVLGLSFGVVALLSPLLSSIADYSGSHKAFMKFFCYLGAISCISLFWFDGTNLVLGLGGMLFATIGYAGSIVFYNSFLPSIASPEHQDSVSAKGFALGYIGASTLLIFNLAAIMNQKALGITDDTLLPRLSFLLTGLWWLGFAQITFSRLPGGLSAPTREGHYLLHGYQQLAKVWYRLQEESVLKYFLLAFFFYIMGVQTVMFMASSFGEKEIGLSVTQLIITVLSLEYVGIAGAYVFAGASKKFGNIPALMVAVGIWIGICVFAYQVKTPAQFFICAGFIGLVMGGIQSLSRSTFAKFIPLTGNNAGYFSFFDVCEKLAMMIGLVLFGYLDHLTGSMRSSILALGVWFVIGFLVLWRVWVGIRKKF